MLWCTSQFTLFRGFSMVISAAIILIAFGSMCLFDKNTAWMLYEADARLTGKLIERTPDWDGLMTTQGFVLTFIGIIGIFVGLM